jgi:GDPmannose 4,6-dehydratase
MPTALITGIGGQDGSYLAELLLDKGYEVFGVVRGSAIYPNLEAIRDRVELIEADLLDRDSLVRALERTGPREVYHLAAPSFVPDSWKRPVETAEFAAVGATSMLEALRTVAPEARFYQASSSEIFGSRPRERPQSERTPLHPLTPYGVAKAYAHFIVGTYRERYGMHVSSGILYNHESPRRPLEFVTRKISHAAAAISLGLQDSVELGNLDACRDWGYAGDYVGAMWLMLQQDEPGDYVIATGVLHSVRDLVERAFARVGLDWQEHVRMDESLQRGKAELFDLVGDPAEAHERLGWEREVDFEQLVDLLVDADLQRLSTVTPARDTV